MKGTTTGKADVYLDDEFKTTVNLAATSATYQVDVWSTGLLPAGVHKFSIVWNKDNLAGKYITLDRVDVAGTLIDPPPIITSLSPTSGSLVGGTHVTINGSGFTGLSGPSAVTFGGLPATTYTVDSSTRITATSPAHDAGAVRVQVTAAGGTSVDTAADDFTYQVAPAFTRYDQVNGNIVKTGSWYDFSSTASYLGSYGRSATGGASATIYFNGTRLDWITMRGTTSGIVDFWVDGERVTTGLNLYTSPAVYQQNVWSTGTLPAGDHWVRLVRSSSTVTGRFLTLDAVEIYGTLNAPPPAPTRYDHKNTDIKKTGVWANYTSTASYLGSYGRSSTDGASATIYFTGSRLDWIGMKGTTTGIADIYLDGEIVVEGLSLYASPATYQTLIWSTGTLASGVHTIRIVRSDTSATGKFLTLDAVEIWGSIRSGP